MKTYIDIEGGTKPGEMVVFYGRQTGKSVMNSYINQWTDIRPKQATITHGTMDHKIKYKCWAKVTGGPWGLENQITEWCEENFGPLEAPGYRNPRWTNKMKWGVWHFKHEQDLMLFLLRWS